MGSPVISILGCGRAGGAIGLALTRAGYTIGGLWSRSPHGRADASTLLGVEASSTPKSAVAGDLVVVAVPDHAIAGLAAEIAPSTRGRLVVHTSGATSVTALDPVLQASGRTGSLHPLQTLPNPIHGADALRGAAVAVTCDEPDRALLNKVATDWGGRPFALRDEDKAVYHAAAVFASNYVVASVWAATCLLEDAGVSGAHELLGPLVRASVANVSGADPAAAITGPVVRGDVTTVRRHLDVIEDPAIRDAYRAMARLVFRLAGLQAPEMAGALEVAG